MFRHTSHITDPARGRHTTIHVMQDLFKILQFVTWGGRHSSFKFQLAFTQTEPYTIDTPHESCTCWNTPTISNTVLLFETNTSEFICKNFGPTC